MEEQNIVIIYESREELLKLVSKLTSIITSGKDIPSVLSKEDLDIIHIESIVGVVGRTQCGVIIADGVRAVKIGGKEKVNCPKCKKMMI